MMTMVIVMILITSLGDYDLHPLHDDHDNDDGKEKKETYHDGNYNDDD